MNKDLQCKKAIRALSDYFEPMPPELDRKDWLRKNVIRGGKDQPS